MVIKFFQIQRFLLANLSALLFVLAVGSQLASAQSLGTAGTVTGVVKDPNGAVVPNATVTISNAVTGYTRTNNTDTDGNFRFNDVPPNVYQLSVSANGFSTATQSLSVRTSVPINLTIPLSIGGASETVTVTDSAANVLENIPTAHTDVDQ